LRLGTHSGSIAGKNGSDEMKRHPALIPLSHDHHHALVEVRRLRRAADIPESAAVATEFLRFFAGETVEHFREEEELLFPLVVDFDEARELLVQALLEHQRLHALTGRLQQLVTIGGDVDDVVRELGELRRVPRPPRGATAVSDDRAASRGCPRASASFA
jgi:hypothetical protein